MISLAGIEPGRSVRFLTVRAGRKLQSRLAAMGLVPGVQLEVVQNARHGPFVIAVQGSRLVIGRGVAQKVLVS